MIKRKTIGDLLSALEKTGFKCTGGSLSKNIDYIIVKDLLRAKFKEKIPDKYVRKYGLDIDKKPRG